MTNCAVKSLETQEIVCLRPGDVLTIGRIPNENEYQHHIRLPFQDVSRTHAEIKWTERGWVIVDLGSSSGTFIFGKQLKKSQERVLAFGDYVSISGHELLVCIPDFQKSEIENIDAVPQQDLTGIAIANTTVLKLSLFRGLSSEAVVLSSSTDISRLHTPQPLDENQMEKHFELLFLLQEILETIRKANGHIHSFNSRYCLASWSSRFGDPAESGSVYTCTMACKEAIALVAAVRQFNQAAAPVLHYEVIVQITLATARAATNIINPDVLLDGAERFVLNLDDSSTQFESTIFTDEATYTHAKDAFSFSPIQSKDAENPAKHYVLLQ